MQGNVEHMSLEVEMQISKSQFQWTKLPISEYGVFHPLTVVT